jgi:hypothetical protein
MTKRGGALRRVIGSAVLVVAVLVGLPAAVASAANSTSGVEHFQVVRVDHRPGVILAQGVFNGRGIDYPRRSADLVVFRHGAFTIDHPNGSVTRQMDPRTCRVTISFSGTYQIDNGFGRFTGIEGFGFYQGSTVGTRPRNANGTCSDRPLFSKVTRISAVGPLSF